MEVDGPNTKHDQVCRNKGGELLMCVAKGLMRDAEEGRLNTEIAIHLGSLAMVSDFPLVQKMAEKLLRDAAQKLLLAGAVTNISEPAVLYRKHQLPSREQIENHDFPRYEHVVDYMRTCAEPHIVLVLDGEVARAAKHAKTPCQMEEFACACAVMGDIDDALAYIGREEFPKDRMDVTLMVAYVESFRRGQIERANKVSRQLCGTEDCGNWRGIVLAAGLLGRLPWPGYPFADY